MLALASAALAVLGACSAGRDEDAARSAGAGATTAAAGQATGASGESSAASSAGGGGGQAAAGASSGDSLGVVPPGASLGAVASGVGSRVVRTADLRVELSGSFADAFDNASRLATGLGGFVAESSAATDGDGTDDEVTGRDGTGRDRRLAGGTLTLRVPSARFDDALAELAKLGRVEQRTVKGEDVGGQLVDLEARLTSLRAQEEAVRAILARATTIADVLAVQDRLTQVRQQVEQLAGQKARLDDAVAFSTVRASLFEPGVEPRSGDEPAAHDGLADRARQAVDAAVAVVGALMVVAGTVAPLVPLALLAWLAWRLVVARRRPRPVAPVASGGS